MHEWCDAVLYDFVVEMWIVQECIIGERTLWVAQAERPRGDGAPATTGGDTADASASMGNGEGRCEDIDERERSGILSTSIASNEEPDEDEHSGNDAAIERESAFGDIEHAHAIGLS